MTRRRRWVIALFAILVCWACIWWAGNDLLRLAQSDRPSVAHGTTADGSLEWGKRFPTSGPNYHAYSRLGALLGRASAHSAVREVVLAAYAELAVRRPRVEWVYGEMGWPSGGPFPPHRTHERGTSIDFFVPVVDRKGSSTYLPTGPTLKFGYLIEFDSAGRWKGFRIDFEALAEHLLILDSIGGAQGVPIERVILAPEFRDELETSSVGRRALATLPWMKGHPWVRHDEHYHVDFGMPEQL